MNNQVCIVLKEVVEKHWDLEADQALQVTLAVAGADKPVRYVVVITDFEAISLTLYRLVSSHVAPRSIIILLLLESTKAIYCLIRLEFLNYFCFPNDKGVYELGERVFPDFHHHPLIEFIKFRG